MKAKCRIGVSILFAAVLCISNAKPGSDEVLQQRIRDRYTRQTPSVDTCVLGCIANAVRSVGLTNLRPSSWSWNFSDLLQSAVLRTYCEAYNQARTCTDSCSLSGSKLLVSALMGVPGLLCTGSAGANACLRNATKSVQSTCDNKCADLKPSFGLRTWMSLSKMSNIFNDMCAYWGCQLTCGKPAVERQCGQESVSLMNRLSGIGLGTLKEALKSSGLTSVCGANATRVPHTYEVVTDRPTTDGGEAGGGTDFGEGGGDDNRPPTDSEEGAGDGFGRPGQGPGGRGEGEGEGEGGGDRGGETGVSLGGGSGGGGGSGHQRVGTGSQLNASSTDTRGRGKTGAGSGRGRGRGRGGSRVTTTTAADVDDGTHLGDEDYWNTIGSGGHRGRGGHSSSDRQRGGGGFSESDDEVPPPRSTGISSRGGRGASLSPEMDGLGDLNQKRRPMRVTTTEYAPGEGSRFQEERRETTRGGGGWKDGRDTPAMRVRDTDQRTGEVHVRLGD